jgi:hypothetical protein
MDENGFKATLNGQSPRYSEWLNILGGDAVPLRHCVPLKATLGEETDVEIYRLNVDAFTEGQRDRLVQFVALKFGVAPALVNADLESVGFPIRAQDVDVVILGRDIGRFL